MGKPLSRVALLQHSTAWVISTYPSVHQMVDCPGVAKIQQYIVVTQYNTFSSVHMGNQTIPCVFSSVCWTEKEDDLDNGEKLLK